MTSPLLLAIDNGTQSVRALVFDLQGNLVCKSKIAIEPYFSQQPGWAEQHASVYWDAVCNACRNIVAELGADAERIAGVAVTTQRATVINVDSNGEPLRPAISWLDQRRAENLSPMGGGWDFLLAAIGQSGAINNFRAQAKSNWLQAHEPDVWRRTHKFLLVSGYLNYKLCGEYVDSSASQVGYIPFNFRKHEWASNFDWKWRATRVAASQLPQLKAPGQRLGQITRQAAQQTGLREGLPVIAAGADKACEILGSGCITPDIGALSYGTTATINACSAKYVEPIPLIPPYPAAMPGAYCTEIQIFRGFWMINWFLNQFGAMEIQQAELQGVAAEQIFDERIGDVPPGSMGLIVQPYWSPGVKMPGPEAKGSIIGFGDVHTRNHVYRAILEGLAYALREGKERIEHRNGIAMRMLRVSGGGSQSDRAMQITADIFGLPVERPHTFETSGLGAAINVAVGVGLHPDFTRAVAAMTRVQDTFTPDAQTRRIYDELYRDVYLKMYARLQPLYRRIGRITGYPKM
jgi:sugar (pentulose or hexulose) kinase